MYTDVLQGIISFFHEGGEFRKTYIGCIRAKQE